MQFTSPPVRFLIKAALLAILLGSLGFFIPLALLPDGFDATLAMAIGSFAGAFLGAWLAGIGETPATAKRPDESHSVFVGNLNFKARNEDLRELFAQYGDVHSVRIMTDRATRRPRGFGFVEMDEKGARKAISALDGQEFLGRKLRVNEGKERRNDQERQREA
ncbi:RNA recognition motif domain-containing protein [Thiohalomonas denitrificans]|uniref:RNA recognition motif. (A.k.a. RRM, RBD, or RNP domain) n=1 Tax=Thiohalomonas denitrificans TaxID=415747 RepID=A0A1G5QHG0_9GAMM|nr:hypothetical protein [Thiohalomonas denitrificans]SCZ61132.1 RNA recognition motif. (a.k.a. RRM, RBD, or RNP domain) [Thiohalomonas denitrificans]